MLCLLNSIPHSQRVLMDTARNSHQHKTEILERVFVVESVTTERSWGAAKSESRQRFSLSSPFIGISRRRLWVPWIDKLGLFAWKVVSHQTSKLTSSLLSDIQKDEEHPSEKICEKSKFNRVGILKVLWSPNLHYKNLFEQEPKFVFGYSLRNEAIVVNIKVLEETSRHSISNFSPPKNHRRFNLRFTIFQCRDKVHKTPHSIPFLRSRVEVKHLTFVSTELANVPRKLHQRKTSVEFWFSWNVHSTSLSFPLPRVCLKYSQGFYLSFIWGKSFAVHTLRAEFVILWKWNAFGAARKQLFRRCSLKWTRCWGKASITNRIDFILVTRIRCFKTSRSQTHFPRKPSAMHNLILLRSKNV